MKRMSFLMLAACFCLPAVGCGGDAATTPAPEATAPATTENDLMDEEAAGSDAKTTDTDADADVDTEAE